MNEYHLQSEKQRSEAQQQRSKGLLGQNSRSGRTSSSTTGGKKGPYSKDFAKVHYRDADMQKIATTGTGTTSAYNYQDWGKEFDDLRLKDKPTTASS